MIRRWLTIGLSSALLTGVAQAAPDAPVAVNPLRQVSEGYMFDWIFFAIMIPIPALLFWDMARTRAAEYQAHRL